MSVPAIRNVLALPTWNKDEEVKCQNQGRFIPIFTHFTGHKHDLLCLIKHSYQIFVQVKRFASSQRVSSRPGVVSDDLSTRKPKCSPGTLYLSNTRRAHCFHRPIEIKSSRVYEIDPQTQRKPFASSRQFFLVVSENIVFLATMWQLKVPVLQFHDVSTLL